MRFKGQGCALAAPVTDADDLASAVFRISFAGLKYADGSPTHPRT